MALERVFEELSVHFHKLRDGFLGLSVIVGEDKPPYGDVHLTEQLDRAVVELLGRVEEALEAAGDGEEAVGYPTDVERARRALAACQQQFHRIERLFASELASYERIDEIRRLGHERGGEWLGWARTVQAALESCQGLLYEGSPILFACWQEIAERAGMPSVSVQATSVGQQITVPEGRELEREGIT